jgi:hypothetical protein
MTPPLDRKGFLDETILMRQLSPWHFSTIMASAPFMSL